MKQIPVLFSLFVFTLAATLATGCASSRRVNAPQADAVPTPPTRNLTWEERFHYNERFLESECQKLKGNYDAQIALLEAALEINPDGPEALADLAIAKYATLGSADSITSAEIDSLLRRAIKLDPGNLNYREVRVDILARNEKYKEAIEELEILAAKKPTTDVLSSLADLYRVAGDAQNAIRTINRLITIDGLKEEYALAKFQSYIELKDDGRAYKALEDLCANYPNELKYRVLLGDMFLQNNHPDQALRVYRDVLTSEPQNAFARISMLAYYNRTKQDSLYKDYVKQIVLDSMAASDVKAEAMRGYAFDRRNEGDSLQVLALFHQALQHPQADRSMAELCAAYMETLRLLEATRVPIYKKILEIEPDYLRARLQLLNIAIREVNLEQIIHLCREGLAYDPGHLSFYYFLGVTLSQKGDDAAAIRILQDGVKQITIYSNSDEVTEIYGALGDLLHQAGDKAGAFSAYQKAIEANPENYPCLNNYAYFLCQAGERIPEAVAMSKRTVDAEADNATYLDTYAYALLCDKQYEQALIYIEEALRRTPEKDLDYTLLLHAGDIHFRLKQQRAALETWRKAAKFAKTKAQQKQIKQRIRRRRI